MLITSFLVDCSLVLAQGVQPTPGSTSRQWLILPGGAKGGDITAETSETDLIKAYGRANVVDKGLDNGNGETEENTVLFPRDPLRRIFIVWKDPARKSHPANISIVSPIARKSAWSTVHGISLGTSLKQLQDLNKKPFSLWGLAVDDPGTVISWGNGALGQELGEAPSPERVVLRLSVLEPASQSQPPQYLSVLGSGFSSDHPLAQTLRLTVYEIEWIFR